MAGNTEAVEQDMTSEEVAAECRVNRSAVNRWIRFGVDGIRLVATRVGGRWMVKRNDLEDFKKALTNLSLPPEDERAAIPEITTQREANKRADAAIKRMKAKGVPIS